MLSEEALDNLTQVLIDRQENINIYVIEKIANYFGTTISALVYDTREQMEE